MKNLKLLNLAFAIIMMFTIVSCNNDDPVDLPKGKYDNGIIVSNEGNFGKPNASVTWISHDFSTVEQNIFGTNNDNAQLGDVLQNIAFSGDLAYLVVNHSNKIQVVNRYTFKKEKEITENVLQPRYAVAYNNNLYVTNSANGSNAYVSVYKTTDNSFVKKIPINKTSEKITEAGGIIFVQNAAWGSGNEISLIDPKTNALNTTISLPNVSISDIKSYAGSLYVLARSTNNVDSYIYQVTPSGSVAKTFALTGIPKVSNLNIYDNKFYFTSKNNAYKMDMSATTAPQSPLFSVEDKSWETFYGFGMVDDKIYVSFVNGFTADSDVNVYDLSGKVIKSFKAGMGANAFYKND